MYGAGDHVGAVVLDMGSAFTKMGLAGENFPRHVQSSAVFSSAKNQNISLSQPRDGAEVARAMSRGAFDESAWDCSSALWRNAMKDTLQGSLDEHPLLVIEPTKNPASSREKMSEILFESDNVPALFIARDAVCSALSVGKTTAAVLDMGAGKTSMVCVHDGYVLNNSVLRSAFAGDCLDAMLQSHFEKETESGEFVPLYRVNRSLTTQGERLFSIRKDIKYTASYDAFMRGKLLQDFKENVCRVSDIPFDAEANVNIPTLPYELPDGTLLAVGTPRFSVPESLFVPKDVGTVLERVTGSAQDIDGFTFTGVHNMVLDSINSCDVDLRRDLCGNIVTVGGSSLFPGLMERLSRELETLSPSSLRVKLVNAGSPMEKKFGPWIGGSVLGSLSTFQQMWISKDEYAEEGARVIASRCP